MKRLLMCLALSLLASNALAQDKVQPPTVSLTVATGKTTAAILELPRFGGRVRTAVDRRLRVARFRLAGPRPATQAGT